MPRPLAVERHGPAGDHPTATPLVLAHGFTQNAACWEPFLGYLVADRRVLAVDLPGHGRSGAVRADLWQAADLLAEVAGGAGGPVDLLGYSLGGRIGLHLALRHPEVVRRLVLVGATAGIADPVARAARRQADDALAARFEADPLRESLDRWLAQPLFRTLPEDRAHLAARATNDPAGLASSLRLAGTGSQEPLWDRLGELTGPVLLVAGVLDVRFAALGAAMARAIGPGASLALVPGAGHACHLEQPALTATVVRRFLDR